MNLVALDLTASQLWAVRGKSPREATTVALQREQAALPMALSLEGRSPTVGDSALRTCRRSPQLACLGFVQHLGGDRVWRNRRHRLDATRAMTIVFDHVSAQVGRGHSVTLAVPCYWDDRQIELAYHIINKARLKPLGSVPRPLAAALAAHRRQPWSDVGMVIDADAHALTLNAVHVEQGDVHVLQTTTLADLSETAWHERILAVIADRCVRQCRRDPRDSADAEQALFDQIDPAVQACAENRRAEISLQTGSWYQEIVLAPEQIHLACARQVQRVISELRMLHAVVGSYGSPQIVVLTRSAARLPGLAFALEELLSQWEKSNAVRKTKLAPDGEDGDDFGEDLIEESDDEAISLLALDDEAIALAAYELGVMFYRGSLEPGHLDVAPILDAPLPDRGPARLQFRAQDYFLEGEIFTLGRAPDCDLVFETEVFPTVSARHCEIVLDGDVFHLHDQSRHGTLLNERPIEQSAPLRSGDWIRLGPGGPLLRFWGRPRERESLTTTA